MSSFLFLQVVAHFRGITEVIESSRKQKSKRQCWVNNFFPINISTRK